MKLQHAAIFFVIIFLPIFMVTSYFLAQQVDTIAVQNSYDAKLLDATHDAMLSLEVNTANEDLSTVSDSLRSIVDASTNIFFNTLATNMGVSNASKSLVQPYVPAILYTLYDGYYIYAPTSSPEVCTDKYGQTISTNSKGVTYNTFINANGREIGIYSFDQSSIKYMNNSTTAESGPTVNYSSLPDAIKEEYGALLYKNKDGTYSTSIHTEGGNNRSTYFKQSYILKSFISYSARYENGDIDIVVDYTLDNFISIEGKIGNSYYTKSGYLIDKDLVKRVSLDSNQVQSWKRYSEESWHDYIYGNNNVTVELNDGTIISNKDTYEPSKRWEDSQSAVEYYINAWMFSSWVYENLSGIQEQNIKNNEYNVLDADEAIAQDTNLRNRINSEYDDMIYEFSGSNKSIFNEDQDPENKESVFAEHKRNVIKNSITYNLILSMITYTEMSRTTEYSMPMLSDPEWDKILSNVSIVSFMQGVRCGLKYYNNYAIVSSTNNELTVTPSEIYYVPAEPGISLTDNNAIETAHRLDCPYFEESSSGNYLSFKAKEVKYDKLYDSTVEKKYVYDHKVYLDYKCIVNSNYEYQGYKNKNVTSKSRLLGNTNILNYLLNQTQNTYASTDAEYNKNKNKLKAYRLALGKERNNLYKYIEFEEKCGYQIINPAPVETINGSKTIDIGLLDKPVSEISRIEIVTSNAKNTSINVFTDSVTVTLGSSNTYAPQTIPVTSEAVRTMVLKKDFEPNENISKITISLARGSKIDINSIKIYYK